MRNTGDLGRHLDHTWQHAWGLHDRHAHVAAERVFAIQLDDEVQALVEHLRKRMRRIEPDRREHRFHLALEIVVQPGELRLAPLLTTLQHIDALGFECGQQHGVVELILPDHQRACAFGDQRKGWFHPGAVGELRVGMIPLLLLQPRHAHLEEFIEVRGHDAQVAQPLEQRHARILGHREHAFVERENTELAIEVTRRGGLAGYAVAAVRLEARLHGLIRCVGGKRSRG